MVMTPSTREKFPLLQVAPPLMVVKEMDDVFSANAAAWTLTAARPEGMPEGPASFAGTFGKRVGHQHNDQSEGTIGQNMTLHGTSDNVTAMDYDDTTDTLHVGTSSGRSDFCNLTRINNTTTAITTVISASNGLIVEQ